MSLDEYFQNIEAEVENIRKIAQEAKDKGGDPSTQIEPKFAEDMAERCQELVEIDGLAEIIRELEEREDIDREEEALEMSKRIANGDIGGFDDKQTRVDKAIRASLALLTEGIVAAPIEGIDSVNIEEGDSGQDFIRVTYAGPIRSAGGTGQALSVLVADYVRQIIDIGKYNAREEEVERTVAELNIYDEDVGLQYAPSDKEVRTIVENVDIMLDAKAADTREVGAYKNLERISGNVARGGMCLTIGEGIAQKAAKLQKYTGSIDIDGWGWLSELKLGVDESEDKTDSEGDGETADSGDEEAKKESLKPSGKYLDGLIGGRPVFAYPSRPGGFRLRYGRARNTGLAASGINPASMVVLNSFIATGTQLKTERPGKAQGMTPVDSIEGPTVKLENGSVTRIDNLEEARTLVEEDKIRDILDIGEMLVNYGEFLENNHRLVPASYTHEWWELEYEKEDTDEEDVPTEEDVSAEMALSISQDFDVPLHPKYTYLWHDIEVSEYRELCNSIGESRQNDDVCLILDKENKSTLEKLLVPYEVDDSGRIIIDEENSMVLEECCDNSIEMDENSDVVELVSEAAGFTVRERAPVRIGARMGRPEKSKRREKPEFHGLIPIGREGGDQRLVNEAVKNSEDRSEGISDSERDDNTKNRGYIEESIARRWCSECERVTWRIRCRECGSRTKSTQYCSDCDLESENKTCPSCGKDMKRWSNRDFDISRAYEEALENIDLSPNQIGKVKGVKGLESETKIVEPFEKALLRAEKGILSFSDGTVRYDLSDLPMTAFKPSEVGVSVEKLRELGYNKDANGEELKNEEQVCELKVQDIVIHDGAAEYMLKTAQFVDDLLEKYYDMDPYYDAQTKEDLVGELFAGLAPHTSAATVCRLIGFTEAQVGYGHPFFHAAKRRNCFSPKTELMVKIDGDWEQTQIGNLVEEYLEPGSDGYDDSYDDGTIVQELRGHSQVDEIKIPSMNDEGEYTIENVTHVSRHSAPNHMVVIQMEDGTELEVTSDHKIPVRSDDKDEVITEKQAHSVDVGDLLFNYEDEVIQEIIDGKEDLSSKEYDMSEVKEVSYLSSDIDYTYNLTVSNTHRLAFGDSNGFKVGANCDGDEDSIMLLLDGLINYSEAYLNHNRQGWSMDRPLVMTTRIEPTEIDDEAHNVDIVGRYPLDFYEATRNIVGPKDVDIEIAEDRIEGDFTGFQHTMSTSSVHAGPPMSSYKTVGDMNDKINAQFDLAERVRAIDQADVAQRLINNHYLPDIRGNLRAFTQQDVRCHSCGESYRRVPLDARCRNCGNDLILNLHEGSVDKYVDAALEMCNRYDVDSYTRQSIEVLQDEIEQIFEDQTTEQPGIGEFM